MDICFTSLISPYQLHKSSNNIIHHKFQSTCTRRRKISCKSSSNPNSAVVKSVRKYEAVTWTQVEQMCNEIATEAHIENFDLVLAITRGGLVPATLICEAFELRNILSATVIFYTDNGDQFFGMTEPRFLSFPSGDQLNGRKVLVVDDVWDSGRTAHAVKERVIRAGATLVKVAVLYFKPDMNIYVGEEPDYYSKVTSDWVLYPWEKASPRSPKITPNAIRASTTPPSSQQEAPIGSDPI